MNTSINARIMHAARKGISPGRSRGLDKTSNGTRLLPDVDMRSASGRRFRHLVDAYAAELGSELSEAELSLIRQACALQLQAEKLQAAIVRGEVVDSDQLIRISSTSKRLLEIIAGQAGKREAPVPSLQDIFAMPAEPEEAAAE